MTTIALITALDSSVEGRNKYPLLWDFLHWGFLYLGCQYTWSGGPPLIEENMNSRRGGSQPSNPRGRGSLVHSSNVPMRPKPHMALA